LLHLSAGGYPSGEGITLKNIIDFWTNEFSSARTLPRERAHSSPRVASLSQFSIGQEPSLPGIAEETKEIFMALFSSFSIPQRINPATAFTKEELEIITNPIFNQLRLFFSDKSHQKNQAYLLGIQQGLQARQANLGLSEKDVQDIMHHLSNRYYVWWTQEASNFHRGRGPAMDHGYDSSFFSPPSETTAPPFSFPSSRQHPSLQQQNKEIEDTSFALFISSLMKETLIPTRPSSSSNTSSSAFTEEQLDIITSSIIEIYQFNFLNEPNERRDYLRGIRRGLETFELSREDVNSIMNHLPGQIDVFLALQLSLTC